MKKWSILICIYAWIRSCAEEALRMLNGAQLSGQNIRLSWGRSPSNKQVDLHYLTFSLFWEKKLERVLYIWCIYWTSLFQPQPEAAQWNAGYYGYAQGYENYGYAPAPQDPNVYYGGYPGYGNYQQPQQQQQQQQQVGYSWKVLAFLCFQLMIIISGEMVEWC